MDYVWIVLGGLLVLGGVAGSFLPLLPGPPLSYIGLLIQQLRSEAPFSEKFLWIWAGVTIVTLILDYAIPVYGTKKYGGTKFGIWGCAIGLVAGFWLGPLGIIIGPFVGAFVGEMIANADSSQAFRAAVGSFVGFLFGTLIKVVVCFVMLYYYVVSWF